MEKRIVSKINLCSHAPVVGCP